MRKIETAETWTDEATGYKCHVVKLPWFCGYVEVPKDHPWYGINYSGYVGDDDIDVEDWQSRYANSPEGIIDVHGGITFSGTPHGQTEGHWFGFDCAHAGDYTDYGHPELGLGDDSDHRWTLDEVKAECARLAKQLHDQDVGGMKGEQSEAT